MASGWANESHRTMVGRRYRAPSKATLRGPLRYLAVTSTAPGVRSPSSMAASMPSAIWDWRKRTAGRSASSGGQRRQGAELLRQRLGDLGGVFRHHHGRGVDATAPAIVGNGGNHEVDELRPALDLVLADEDLAVAGAVDLDGRVVGVLAPWCSCRQRPAPGRRHAVSRRRLRGRWDKSRTPRPDSRRR